MKSTVSCVFYIHIIGRRVREKCCFIIYTLYRTPVLCNTYTIYYVHIDRNYTRACGGHKAAHGSVRLTFEYLQSKKLKSCFFIYIMSYNFTYSE